MRFALYFLCFFLLLASSFPFTLPFQPISAIKASEYVEDSCCCRGKVCSCKHNSDSSACSIQKTDSKVILIKGSACSTEEEAAIASVFSKEYCLSQNIYLFHDLFYKRELFDFINFNVYLLIDNLDKPPKKFS